MAQDCERLRADYIVVMEQFNTAQREFFKHEQLRLFNDLQTAAEVSREEMHLTAENFAAKAKRLPLSLFEP